MKLKVAALFIFNIELKSIVDEISGVRKPIKIYRNRWAQNHLQWVKGYQMSQYLNIHLKFIILLPMIAKTLKNNSSEQNSVTDSEESKDHGNILF